AREARVDDLDERVGITLTRLPLRKRVRHRRQRDAARPCLKELPFAPFHGSPFVEQRILVIGAALLRCPLWSKADGHGRRCSDSPHPQKGGVTLSTPSAHR